MHQKTSEATFMLLLLEAMHVYVQVCYGASEKEA